MGTIRTAEDNRAAAFAAALAAARSDLERALLFNLRDGGLPAPVADYRAVESRRWKWDLAYPGSKLLIEIDGGGWTGGRHARGAGIEQDAEKQSTAAAEGWRTMRLTGRMVRDGRAVALVTQALRCRRGCGALGVHLCYGRTAPDPTPDWEEA